jgi:hypothetical protein
VQKINSLDLSVFGLLGLFKKVNKAISKNKLSENRHKHNTTSYGLFELGKDDVDIVLLENYQCNSKNELRARERYWIECTSNCVNKNISTRTIKKWQDDNKKMIVEKTKKYYDENIDKIKAYRAANKDTMHRYMQDHYKVNKVTIQKYQQNGINKIKKVSKKIVKKRCKENKDAIAQREHQYYPQNFETINDKQKEKYQCDTCNSNVRKGDKSETSQVTKTHNINTWNSKSIPARKFLRLENFGWIVASPQRKKHTSLKWLAMMVSLR